MANKTVQKTGPDNVVGPKRAIRGQRLVCIFLLGVVLFNFPVLAVFNVGATLFGIPILFAYLFLAWAAVILLIYLAVEKFR
jgi:threonine/homoserine/homoserine lactone efflux protein